MQTCHGSQSAVENLVLEPGVAHGQIVDVPSIESSLLRVNPGDPATSFLFLKLTGPPAGQGSPMPLTGGSLSPAEIQMVRDWIKQGAQP